MNSGISSSIMIVAGLAAVPVAAQGDANVDVLVQEIAILEVAQSDGFMVINDTSFSVMGNPSSDGDVLDGGNGNYARVALRTNVCLDLVLVEFPRAAGFRNAPAGSRLAVATGQDTGNSLGVWPRAFRIDTVTGDFMADAFVHDGSDSDLSVSGPSGLTQDFCNGVHELALGVATAYDITLDGEQALAPPDTYIIPLTGTLVP